MDDHEPARGSGDDIRAGNITNAQGVAIGRGARATVINLIVQGLGELPTRFDGDVRNFLEYYLGAPDKPAPFGGRRADLERLDAWLDRPDAPRYALLAAPAGRGKSALLANWVAQLEGRDGLRLVYFPISIRYATNREIVVFSALAARLAHVFGEKAAQAYDASQYRGVYLDYLRKPPADGGRVLVVLDGLDEAAWEIGAELFPTEPPEHLRVLVAARPRAGDLGAAGWLNRLGWERPGQAEVLGLSGLDLPGVRDVLEQMGNPLDALAAKFDVVKRLHELSEGDPLLVRLYVEALLPWGEQAALLTPADLLELQPGLKAYLDRWWDEQRRLWGPAGPLRERGVKALLNLCATALGPLSRDDVLALAGDDLPDSWALAEAAHALGRLLIGDGKQQGYTFSHPRLRDYFAEALMHAERAAWQARYLRYGRETLAAVEAGRLQPAEASAYVVRYYGEHLELADASPAEFYALMCASWLCAWEWADGTPDGFLTDVRRAWRRAEREGPGALGQVVRAALCVSSVAPLSANLSTELLRARLGAGVMSTRQALVLSRCKPDAEERAKSLLLIGEFLASSEQRAVLKEALSAARAIRGERRRAEALSALAEQLPAGERAAALKEALDAARAIIGNAERRAEALSVLAEQLAAGKRAAVLKEALDAARTIRNEWRRAEALSALAERLPADAPELLKEALGAMQAISFKELRARALSALAERLPAEERAAMLKEALSTVRALGDGLDRVKALSAVAERLPADERAAVLSEALGAARTIGYEGLRASALCTVAERLPVGERAAVWKEALDAARAVTLKWEYNISRDYDLMKMAERLAADVPELLKEALSAAWDIEDEGMRARALSAVAERLPAEERAAVLKKALDAARAIRDERWRAEALSALAARLPQEMTEIQLEVLREVPALVNEDATPEIVQHLAPHWAGLCRANGLSETTELSKLLGVFSGNKRGRLLRVIGALLPVIHRLGGEGAMRETARAITDTARWWP